MTTYYVDSAAASSAAPYDTWAKAALLLNTIALIDVAGDTVYVANTHAESTAGAVGLNWAGTPTNPTRIICADKTSGAPPATLAASATVTTTGNNSITASGGTHVYFYGINFVCGSGASGTAGFTGGNNSVFKNCSVHLATTGAASLLSLSNATYYDLGVKFGAAGQSINPGNSKVIGGSLLAGGTSPTALFFAVTTISFENFDLSNAASTINIFPSGAAIPNVRFKKIKLPASWSGAFCVASNFSGVCSVELINSDNAATNYYYHRQTLYGDVYHETSVVRTGGASDGTTPLSWKFTSLAASGVFPIGALISAEIKSPWNDTVGSSVTATVELVHDNATGLKDNEIWMEVRYPSSTTTPLGALATSAPDVLNAGTTVTSSSEVWSGTGGFGTATKQKVSVAFTPQMKGPVYVTVFLAKASYTVYVDPKVTLSVGGNVIASSRQHQDEGGPYNNEGYRTAQLVNSGALVG